MKFKSAEADWNTSFVPQAGQRRNLWKNLTQKLYRRQAGGWVYWADGEYQPGGGDVIDEEGVRVRRKFRDERVVAGWFVRGGTECDDYDREEG
jgi:hypothetical protein